MQRDRRTRPGTAPERSRLGGALAVVGGPSENESWLGAPLLWLGGFGSAATGLWLVRWRGATTRDVVEGLVPGLVIFGGNPVSILDPARLPPGASRAMAAMSQFRAGRRPLRLARP